MRRMKEAVGCVLGSQESLTYLRKYACGLAERPF